MTGVRTETTPTTITTGTGQGATAHVPTGYPTGASYPRRSNTPTRRAGTDPRTLVVGTMAADTATGGMAAAHTAVGTAVVVDMAVAGTAVVVGTAAADTAAAGTAAAGSAVAADTAAAVGTAADTAVAADTAAAAADTDESVIVTERSPGTTRRMCILYNFLIVPPLRNHWDRDVSIITSLRSTYESLIKRART